MIGSLRAEILKSRKRWANWILFGILMLLVLAFSYVLTYILLSHPPRNFESRVPASVLKRETFPENLLPAVLSSMTSVGAAIMIILGGLSTASEYGWSTVQTILVQKPGRSSVLGGKLANLAIISFLVSVAVLGGSALTSYLLVTIDGSHSDFASAADILKGFGGLWLQLAVWTGFGMFLGIAFRSTAAAIGGGLTYLFVAEALIGQLLRDTPGVKEVLKFLPGVNAAAMNSAFPLSFQNLNAPAPLVSAGRGALTLAIYLVVFTVLALLIFRSRDVTGA